MTNLSNPLVQHKVHKKTVLDVCLQTINFFDNKTRRISQNQKSFILFHCTSTLIHVLSFFKQTYKKTTFIFYIEIQNSNNNDNKKRIFSITP